MKHSIVVHKITPAQVSSLSQQKLNCFIVFIDCGGVKRQADVVMALFQLFLLCTLDTLPDQAHVVDMTGVEQRTIVHIHIASSVLKLSIHFLLPPCVKGFIVKVIFCYGTWISLAISATDFPVVSIFMVFSLDTDYTTEINSNSSHSGSFPSLHI